jgi:hypothetical protein
MNKKDENVFGIFSKAKQASKSNLTAKKAKNVLSDDDDLYAID